MCSYLIPKCRALWVIIRVYALWSYTYGIRIWFVFSQERETLKLIHLSVRQSVRHKNFNLVHIFWSINDRALIFGMHDPCAKPFQFAACFVTLTYFKVKVVAWQGTTIHRICLYWLKLLVKRSTWYFPCIIRIWHFYSSTYSKRSTTTKHRSWAGRDFHDHLWGCWNPHPAHRVATELG